MLGKNEGRTGDPGKGVASPENHVQWRRQKEDVQDNNPVWFSKTSEDMNSHSSLHFIYVITFFWKTPVVVCSSVHMGKRITSNGSFILEVLGICHILNNFFYIHDLVQPIFFSWDETYMQTLEYVNYILKLTSLIITVNHADNWKHWSHYNLLYNFFTFLPILPLNSVRYDLFWLICRRDHTSIPYMQLDNKTWSCGTVVFLLLLSWSSFGKL